MSFPNRWNRYLSTDGTTAGTKNMARVADEYYLQAAADETLACYRMIVYYDDAGTFAEAGYAAGTALTTGIELELKDDDGTTVLVDLLDGLVIKTNGDWTKHSFDSQSRAFGAGDNAWAVRWTFTNGGGPYVLRPGQRLSMTVNDTLAGLTSHYALIQGTFLNGGDY